MRKEIGPMLRLATPLALTELGWMVMGVVDTIMAGRLNAAAVGAGTLGNMLFYPIAICGAGMLLGMDTLVSQAFGAGDARDCRRSLVNGLWLAVAVSPPIWVVLLLLIPALRVSGVNPNVFAQFKPYLVALLWGIPPLLFYAAFRRYLQAVNLVQPMLFAMISANVLNVIGNWALMFGHMGAPAMGLTGSGWSTTISTGLHGCRGRGSRSVARAEIGPPSTRSVMDAGSRAHRAASSPRTSGGDADSLRRFGVRLGNGVGGTAGRSVARRAQHRGASDRDKLHGSAGHQLRGGGSRGPSDRPRRSVRRGDRGMDGARNLGGFHGLGRNCHGRGAAKQSCGCSLRTRRWSQSARCCCESPHCSNSSMDSRSSPQALCAAWAIPARR